ncbi:MAG TPA: nucleotide exchange factor GrpE, partial [Rubricoccaceae bacterium]
AEFQNYRRRTEADRAAADSQARAAVLLPVLDVYDDLRRSLDAAHRVAHQDAGSSAFEALGQGVDLVYRKFEGILERFGVTAIETAGVPFDEAEHEAVMQQPAPAGEPSGTVLAEVQPGYRLGDRVLRHARVIVAQ